MIASPEVSGDGGGVRLVRRRGQMDVTIKVKRVGVRKKKKRRRRKRRVGTDAGAWRG